MITGVVGYRFNTNKALNTVELYACQQIDNLGEWVVRYDAIGGVGKQVGLTGSAAAGDFIYVNIYSDAVGDVDGFPDFFGGSHQAIPFGTVDIGREYIQLMKHSVTVDRYGDAATTNWIYTDGWAHRKDGQLPSTTYESTQWTTGSLVGKTVHEANGEGAFPKGAYSATGQGSCIGAPLMIAGVASHRFSSDGIDNLSINMVELYARADIPDLSGFKVRYTTAGQDSEVYGKEVTLTGCLASGQYLRVQIWDDAADNAGLNGYGYFFKMDADYPQQFSSVLEGEEYIAVYQDGSLVDMYGSTSGQSWYYKNQYAYRKEGTQPTATYSAADWTVGSLNGLTENLQSGFPVFPTGTITTDTCSELGGTLPADGCVRSGVHVGCDQMTKSLACSSQGDPHVITFSGKHAHPMGVGAFVLATCNNDFTVQVCHQPVTGLPDLSVNHGFIVKSSAGTVKVLPSGTTKIGDATNQIVISGNKITFPGGEVVSGTYDSVSVKLPASCCNKVKGLCGTFNPALQFSDVYTTASGTVGWYPSSRWGGPFGGTFQTEFVESWRVAPGSNDALFTEAECPTGTPTIPTDPPELFANCPEKRAQAEANCPQGRFYESCLTDVGVTCNDAWVTHCGGSNDDFTDIDDGDIDTPEDPDPRTGQSPSPSPEQCPWNREDIVANVACPNLKNLLNSVCFIQCGQIVCPGKSRDEIEALCAVITFE
jgi:hypothetical protein